MERAIQTIREVYSPLKFRNFRIYIIGQAVSLLGSWMQSTAQSWVVWQISHSELQLGIVFTLTFIPFLILGPFSGVWADRLDRRKLLIATQISSLVLAVAFAVLVQTNTIQIWHIYILATLLGIVNTLDMPAQQAFIGDLSGMGHLRKAIIINSTIVQISRMLGPALAGWVIAAVGVAPAFWLNGISFIAVITSLLIISSHQIIKPKSERSLNEFWEGMLFIRNNPRLLDLVILTLMLTFFSFSSIQMLPAITTKVLHGNADVLGYLLGASGAGALIGSMFIVHLTNKVKRTGLATALSVMWTGAWFVLFSLSDTLFLSLICIFMSGLLIPAVYTTTNGLLQQFAPQHMRARVLSALLIAVFGVQPIASLFIGFTATALGAPKAIFINGSLTIIGGGLLLLTRRELVRWQVDAKKIS